MHKPVLMFGIVVALATLCAVAQAAATAEPMDLDPDMLSKLALERAKASSAKGKSASDNKRSAASNGAGVPGADCGAIAIGNLNTGGRIGFQPREITVVITGDVINANNNCR